MGKLKIHNSQIWAQEGCPDFPIFWLYCLAERGTEKTGPCKIGVATHLNTRISGLQCGNWRELVLVWQIRMAKRKDALHTEQYCLISHRPDIYTPNNDKRLQSEWIDCSPSDALKTALRILNVEQKQYVRVS